MFVSSRILAVLPSSSDMLRAVFAGLRCSVPRVGVPRLTRSRIVSPKAAASAPEYGEGMVSNERRLQNQVQDKGPLAVAFVTPAYKRSGASLTELLKMCSREGFWRFGLFLPQWIRIVFSGSCLCSHGCWRDLLPGTHRKQTNTSRGLCRGHCRWATVHVSFHGA